MSPFNILLRTGYRVNLPVFKEKVDFCGHFRILASLRWGANMGFECLKVDHVLGRVS